MVKSPIETVFEWLVLSAKHGQETVKLDDMIDHFKSIEPVKIIQIMSNFKRIKLIKGNNWGNMHTAIVYTLEIEAILKFGKEYKNGKVKLWYDHKGQEKKIIKDKKTGKRMIPYERFKGSCSHLAKRFPDIPEKLANVAQFYARAAIACQTESFTNRRMEKFANDHDIDISSKDFGNFNSRHRLFFDRLSGSTRKANNLFFDKYKKEKEYYKMVFPEYAETIYLNFAERKTANQKPAEKIEEAGPATDSPAAVATVADDPTEEAGPANDPIEDNQELIDIANVGQAIVSYVNKLKKEAAATTESKEYRDLKAIYDDQSQALVNARNEIQGQSSLIEKFKSIVESQNEKIRDLSHKLSVAENRAIPEAKPIDGKFKLSEVGRITKLIKGNQTSNPNGN